jgi:uncharacterized integral membrane protein
MIRKTATTIVLVPLAVIIIAFAVANRQTVTVSFDPFDTTNPAFSAAMPLFVLIFVLLILGALIGGTAAWLRQGRWRQTARRLDSDIRGLRAEMDGLRRQVGREPARLDPPSYPPLPTTTLRAPVE